MQERSLNLAFYPEKILSTVCKPVIKITNEIKILADEMLEKMYASNGIGLAAPQIGQAIQLICVDVSEDRSEPLQLLNPKILQKVGNVVSAEGCLSIPGVQVSILRAEKIEVSALTMFGPKTFWADGLLSICLQHEIDHLDGKTMLDRLSSFKRERAISKFQKNKLFTMQKR